MSRSTWFATLAVCLAACASPTGPGRPLYVDQIHGSPNGISVLVRNNSCFGNDCLPLRVDAFPDGEYAGPAGPVHFEIGFITTREACITFPDHLITSDSMYVIWEPSMPTALAVVPATTWPWDIGSTTAVFTPAAADGWRVSSADTSVTPTLRCTPTS